MTNNNLTAVNKNAPGTVTVVLAFIAVYLVWGSTYFFIRRALVGGFPPLLLGMIRFLMSGLIMFCWAAVKEKELFNRKAMVNGLITGFLILFIGNGMVIFVEQYVPSAWVAIIVSAAPLWFVLFDKPHWGENLKSKSILAGLALGIVGIFLLYAENLTGAGNGYPVAALIGLIIGSMCWVIGSLISKYRKPGFSSTVNSTWQMVFAGMYFGIAALLHGEFGNFHPAAVTTDAWVSLLYLVFFGSLLAYSCYIWLVEVQPPAKVSTYAYVNPVVAVILGVLFAGEHISGLQIAGLSVILLSVLLINLNKYLKKHATESKDSLTAGHRPLSTAR